MLFKSFTDFLDTNALQLSNNKIVHSKAFLNKNLKGSLSIKVQKMVFRDEQIQKNNQSPKDTSSKKITLVIWS